MRDRDLELYIEEMEEPCQFRTVTQAAFSVYRGVMPDKLLECWQDVGWSGFADGLFWLVNPADYDHIIEM
jgi:hypothetical protein